MKNILVRFFQKRTQEFEENSLSTLIIIFFIKKRHQYYHSDWIKYGKMLLVLFIAFLVIAVTFHYFYNKDLMQKKYGYSETEEPNNNALE